MQDKAGKADVALFGTGDLMVAYEDPALDAAVGLKFRRRDGSLHACLAATAEGDGSKGRRREIPLGKVGWSMRADVERADAALFARRDGVRILGKTLEIALA